MQKYFTEKNVSVQPKKNLMKTDDIFGSKPFYKGLENIFYFIKIKLFHYPQCVCAAVMLNYQVSKCRTDLV